MGHCATHSPILGRAWLGTISEVRDKARAAPQAPAPLPGIYTPEFRDPSPHIPIEET